MPISDDSAADFVAIVGPQTPDAVYLLWVQNAISD